LLGAALLSADAARTLTKLGASAFYKPDHQHIAHAIAATLNGGHVDPILVAGFLNDAGLLDTIGGTNTLLLLQEATPAISNHTRYAHRITEAADRRRILRLASDLSEAIFDGDDDAIATTINNLTRTPDHHAPTLADRLRTNLFTGHQVTTLPPPDPLIDGLLFTPGVSVVYGPPKTGKTFYTIALALAVAHGLSFDGRVTEPTPVLYLMAEGRGGLGARLTAWTEHHQRPLPDNFHIETTAINLLHPDQVTLLANLVIELGAGLVILDTLARCTVGADENSGRDMSLIVGALDTLRDAAGHCLVVHHTGKNTAAGLRGHSGLAAALDTAIEVTGDATSFQVAVPFQKDAATPPTAWWTLTPAGDSRVATPISRNAATEASASTWATLDALRAIHVEGGISATDWHAACDTVSRPSFFRARKWLLEHGFVTKTGRTYNPTPKDTDDPAGR
jgi:hypothetical protein